MSHKQLILDSCTPSDVERMDARLDNDTLVDDMAQAAFKDTMKRINNPCHVRHGILSTRQSWGVNTMICRPKVNDCSGSTQH